MEVCVHFCFEVLINVPGPLCIEYYIRYNTQTHTMPCLNSKRTGPRAQSYDRRLGVIQQEAARRLGIGPEDWPPVSRVRLTCHPESVTCLCFSPNGKLIATGSVDSLVRLFHVDSGKLYRVLRRDKDTEASETKQPQHAESLGQDEHDSVSWVRSICFNTGGNTPGSLLASSANDGKVWAR